MTKDTKLTLKVKRYLIGANIVFSFLLLSLILYWFVTIRQNQIEKGEKFDQYQLFTRDNLPFNTQNSHFDYITSLGDVANVLEEIDFIKKELITISKIFDPDTVNVQENFSNKRSDLIKRINKIFTQNTVPLKTVKAKTSL